ncbi:VOC family protein [Aeromonas enteropelogenes]|uniref:VOC family protein n=1 Tax=Aeromonas enteropelogenes TaxID=29489 RepID=UPI003BA2B291
MVTMSHSLDSTLGPMAPFVSQLLTELAALGVNMTAPHIDHLCYRAANLSEYQSLCEVLAGAGELLVEGMIGGRPIATYRLHQPVRVGDVEVPCIELAAPKPGRSHQAGLEHIELVVPSLAALVERYPALPFKTGNMMDERNPDIGLMLPSGQIKFHLRSLAEVIAEEVATGAVVLVPADYFSRA